jgi:GH15 family glucan-1,4-alpha-glucosidase
MVPAYAVTDKYVTSPTMLVRAGADGLIREIWSGMDAVRMRHVPLFLETAIFGEIRSGGGGWTDLRTLKYLNDGTRPGDILLTSDDGRVKIEIMARRKAELSPIFVFYSFSSPVDFRLTARFERPEFTKSERADDSAGYAEFTTAWRDQNAVLTTSSGPDLYLATLPAGRTASIDGTGMVKEVDSTSEVVLCIDATESNVPGGVGAGKTYVDGWRGILGGYTDTEYSRALDHVSLASDNPKFDKLFADSIDAIESHQFASGNLLADLFFYRDSWIRDGSYTIIGLSLAGNYKAAERFFAFWDANRNSYVGGEREAQQPAIGVTAMWLYSRLAPDGTAFLKTHWSYVLDYCNHCVERIDNEGMMNVAEEWICFIPSPATWPNAEIYGGLRAGAKIAKALGQPKEEAEWTRAADRLKAAFDATAYDEATGKFIPMAGKPGEIFRDPEFPKQESRNGPTRDDRTDSGMLMVARMEAFGKGEGIVPVDDPRFTSTQGAIRRDLENTDHSIFRFGPNPSSPHAPQGELDTWPINTAWAAQDEWLLGRTDLAWRYLISGVLNKTKYDLAGACYYLPENWDRNGVVDKPMIVWSHGDFVTSTMLLLLGIDLEPEGADLGLAPSLPPGMKQAHLRNFRFRDWRLDIDLNRDGKLVDVAITPWCVVSGQERTDEVLSVRSPIGKVIELKDRVSDGFTVDPSQYYLEFGRSRHALERAAVVSRILNQAPPKPLAAMSPAELENFIVKAETDFVPTAN